MTLARHLVLLAFSIPAILAQRPSFEVASLKPVQLTGADSYNANLGTARNGVVTLVNATLADCLRYAYTISNDAQLSGPDWMHDKSVRFDITGKAAPETPLPQLREMLQTLLAERLKLELHREPRTMSFLAIVPGKNGHKLTPAVEGSDGSRNRSWLNSIISNRMAMPMLATLLSRFTRETVIDMTGLTGYYELKLEWVPEGKDADGPTLYSAVQEQLGLKLEPRKGPVDVLVIDRAERVPLAN